MQPSVVINGSLPSSSPIISSLSKHYRISANSQPNSLGNIEHGLERLSEKLICLRLIAVNQFRGEEIVPIFLVDELVNSCWEGSVIT